MIIRQQQTQCPAQLECHTQIKQHVNIINRMNIQILIVNIIIIRNMTRRWVGNGARLEIIILRKFLIILFLNSQFICYYSR